MPAGREMNIVSFTALRFGNLAIISAWTIEEMLSGKKATHRLGLGLMLQPDLDLLVSLPHLPFPSEGILSTRGGCTPSPGPTLLFPTPLLPPSSNRAA